MKKIKEEYTKHEEIINYLIVGVLTTIVSMGSYFVLVSTILDATVAIQLQIANIISWVLAVLFSFFANRIFVFKSKDEHIFKEIFKFVNSRIVTLLLDMFIMYVMVTLLSINDLFAKLFVQFVVTITNYFFSKLIVFKKEKK